MEFKSQLGRSKAIAAIISIAMLFIGVILGGVGYKVSIDKNVALEISAGVIDEESLKMRCVTSIMDQISQVSEYELSQPNAHALYSVYLPPQNYTPTAATCLVNVNIRVPDRGVEGEITGMERSDFYVVTISESSTKPVRALRLDDESNDLKNAFSLVSTSEKR